jgi:hypothetical protein
LILGRGVVLIELETHVIPLSKFMPSDSMISAAPFKLARGGGTRVIQSGMQSRSVVAGSLHSNGADIILFWCNSELSWQRYHSVVLPVLRDHRLGVLSVFILPGYHIPVQVHRVPPNVAFGVIEPWNEGDSVIPSLCSKTHLAHLVIASS